MGSRPLPSALLPTAFLLPSALRTPLPLLPLPLALAPALPVPALPAASLAPALLPPALRSLPAAACPLLLATHKTPLTPARATTSLLLARFRQLPALPSLLLSPPWSWPKPH